MTASLPYGSGEAFIIPEIQELRRKGHEVIIVPRSPRGCVVHNDAHNLVNITIKEPLISRNIVTAAQSSFQHCPQKTWSALGLIRYSRSMKVLLKNLAVYLKGLWLAQTCMKWGAEHIHAHWASTTATMALVASKVSGVPWSFTAHRWDIKERNLLKVKTHNASFARTISEKGALKLSELADFPRECIKVIHVGINLPELPPVLPEPKRYMPQCPFRLVVPANLVEVKGHRFLFDAMKDFISSGLSISLDVAGDGPLRDKLIDYVDHLGIAKSVDFLGVVPHDELLYGMEQGKWHLCVLPSITTADGEHEGIPVSLMEAMARKVPVISTRSGSIPELLCGEAGLIVPPGDAAALAEAITMLMCDTHLRAAIAEKGRERVQDEFAIEAIVNDLLTNMQEK